MWKKLTSALLSAIILCGFTSITAVASSSLPEWWNDSLRIFDYKQHPDAYDSLKEFFMLCRNAEYDEIEDYYRNQMQGDGFGQHKWLPDEAVDCFRSGKNGLIKINYTAMDHTRYDFIPDDHLRYDGFDFEIYTDKYRHIEKIYHLDERTVYSVNEVLSDSEIDLPENACWVHLSVSALYSVIDSVTFYDCTNGWNTIDGEKYYVKADGSLATKSMIIDGVRYKFGKDGICGGKYTGWTKNSKGRRYWKDGELQKNTEITTKSGKTYTIDKNGYAKMKRQSA